ncbi:TIGR03364 family FAD-dependent oxidoreductase [Acidisoma silvae]|uniref:TIGR03364 family FAD-dependent oxidoreductase n=1 Tax=Acidisoma silvae TaxID=2802396 RepID=A0A963YSX5_9PROT|nr:TIGR03364 family FAD-dependent oxidoreductase [Acidisoma silvae]MCB8876442.1 TIGR03364 family FAD-dependent oxidoreductase [Acidisoma silvae]
MTYDIAIVGAGIVGIAHALAASRLGLRVVMIDRDQRSVGASIRNFGFVTVTGQQQGECWRRAMRSRDIWEEVAPQAGISVLHQGLAVVARRPEAAVVLEAFRDHPEMGVGCELLSAEEGRKRFPWMTGEAESVLYSPHDRRVESREAIPRLNAWLAEARGVTVLRGVAVHGVERGRVFTSDGVIEAAKIAVCPGDDLATLFPDRLAEFSVTRSKLQMMRLKPRKPLPLGCAVMTDLSLVRYLGYSELPEAAPLLARLKQEQAPHLAGGVHLIAVQSADGSLVVGDTHVYGTTMDPFGDTALDDLVLDEFHAVFPGVEYDITERWIGTYASAPDRLALLDKPMDDVALTVVTSGTGASTAFAIGEEVIQELCA